MHIKNIILVVIILLTSSISFAQPPGLKPGEKMSAVTKLSLPEKKWFAEIETKGFTVEKSGEKPEGQGIMFLATNKDTGVIMSVYFIKGPKLSTSKEVREYYWGYEKKGPFKIDDVKFTDFGEMPLIEYTIKEAQGMQIDQKHYRGFIAKEDLWFDIHLSKVKYKAEEEKLFTSILKSVKISAVSATQ
jgi:hypothetical protein